MKAINTVVIPFHSYFFTSQEKMKNRTVLFFDKSNIFPSSAKKDEIFFVEIILI